MSSDHSRITALAVAAGWSVENDSDFFRTNSTPACLGDMDGDGDSDGIDLSLYAAGGVFSDLADFVADYGSICPLPARGLIETKVFPSEALGGDLFAQDMAADGDTVVSVAPGATIDGVTDSGAAYVYEWDEDLQTLIEVQRLLPDSGDFDSFNMTVEIDGDVIAVGAYTSPIAGFQYGAVYIFERDSATGIWAQSAVLTDPTVGFSGHFGVSLAIQDDIVVVGADQQPTSNGRVKLFQRDEGGPGAWGEVATISDSVAGDGGSREAFGSAVALEGELLVVGAERADVSGLFENDGAVYLLRRDGFGWDSWSLVTRLVAPGSDECGFFDPDVDPADVDACRRLSQTDHDSFGASIAIEGETLIIGAPDAEGADGSFNVGAAHVFRQSDTDEWSHVARLIGSDDATPGGDFDSFGEAVDIDGNTILVSAPRSAVEGIFGHGVAYVFERSAADQDDWTEGLRVIPADGASDLRFGSDVAFADSALLFAAEGDTGARGSIYFYVEPAPEVETPFTPTGTLSDGGLVTDASGASLGAVPGALEDDTEVSIEVVDAPDEPLPGGAPVGDYFRVSAEASVAAPVGTPFVFGLPIPDGVDPLTVRASLLAPTSRLADGPQTGSLWVGVAGNYEAASGLYVIRLASLHRDGAFIVLEGDGAGEVAPAGYRGARPGTSPENPEQPADRPVLPAGRPSPAAATVPTSDGFTIKVECASNVASANCSAYEQLTAQAVADTYNEFVVSKGFRFTRMLPGQCGIIGGFSLPWCESTNEIGPITLRGSGNCGDGSRTKGVYSLESESFDLCFDVSGAAPTALNDEAIETIRHEFFHAIQHSYSDRTGVKEEDLWILDGTATAVQTANEELTRSKGISFTFRVVDKSLLAYEFAYETQDFWIHFGRTRSLDESYLTRLLETGDTTDKVAQFTQTVHGTDLGEAHWEYVKNQTFEKTFNFDGFLNDPCELKTSGDERSVEATARLSSGSSYEGKLSALGAKVIEVPLVEVSFPAYVWAKPRFPNGSLNYKVYVEGEANCAGLPENQPREFTRPPSGTVYVLVQYPETTLPLDQSGGSMDGQPVRAPYEVRVDPSSPSPF